MSAARITVVVLFAVALGEVLAADHPSWMPADLGEVGVIRAPIAVRSDGLMLVSSWGVMRSHGSESPSDWTKYDGQVTAVTHAGDVLWTSQLPAARYCSGGGESQMGCPGSVAYMGGTIDAKPVFSHDESTVYLGRGDGSLYALDSYTGVIQWTFQTHDPARIDTAEAGGEITGAPALLDDGTVVFATAAVGPRSTNAVYRVASDGTMMWRSPQRGSTPNPYWSGPVLSLDGDRVYLAGGQSDKPGSVVAIDIDGQVAWTRSFAVLGGEFDPERVVVDREGTLLVGGTIFGDKAVVIGVDDGDGPTPGRLPRHVWSTTVGGGPRVTGLAATDGMVFVGTGHRWFVDHYPTGGAVSGVSANTGEVLWKHNPGEAGGATVTGIHVSGEGVLVSLSSGSGHGLAMGLTVEGEVTGRWWVDGLIETAPIEFDGTVWMAVSNRCFEAFQPVEWGDCDVRARLNRTSPRLSQAL